MYRYTSGPSKQLLTMKYIIKIKNMHSDMQVNLKQNQRPTLQANSVSSSSSKFIIVFWLIDFLVFKLMQRYL